jgi:putative sulfotransferase
MACLPHLGGTGDDLLEALCAEVRTWAAAPVGHQYRRLFDGLARRFGRRRWIERSGGSLAYLGPLLEAFPEARIVHLWRDGLACSASMARHSPFRLGLMRREMVRRFGVDPYASTVRPPALLASEYAGVLPESFDPAAFRGLDLPLSKFAGIWSSQILHGTARLAEVPAERVLHLRFEDLLADPSGQIRHLSAFIEGEAEEGWIREAAGLIDPGRTTPPPLQADARTRRLIEEGRRILRAAGVPGA